MDFAVERERRGQVTVIKPQGEVDIYTAPTLKEHIASALDEGDPGLVIDLSGVGFMDSSGLGVLVGALKRVNDAGGSLRLVCPEGGVLKVFRITGLTKVFSIHSTLEAAFEERRT